MNRSTFPASIDVFLEHLDLQASEKAMALRWEELMSKTSLTQTEQAELASLTTQLRSVLFMPEDFNKLQDAITNLEVFFKDNVTGYMSQKQTEYQAYIDDKSNAFNAKLGKFTFRDEYNPTTQYYAWNTVSYNGETYLCLVDTKGNAPNPLANTQYWAKLAQQGAKGEKGDRGFDGIGLNWKGLYDPLTSYNENDIVTFNGSAYVTKMPCIGVVPTDKTKWDLLIAKGSNTMLSSYENRVTITSSVVNIPIGISAYNPDIDILFVFKDGKLIRKGIDYTVNTNRTSIDNKGGTWNGTSGTPIVFDFTVIKDIVSDALYEDGAMLSPKSVTLDKLDDVTQGKINNAISKTLASSKNDMLFASGLGEWEKKSLAESKSILGISTLNTLPTTTGTSTAFVVALPDFSLTNGAKWTAKFHTAGTGSPTATVNGTTACALKKSDNTTAFLPKVNGVYTFAYDSASGNFVVQGEGASGDALASDLLSGKKATTDAGEIVGTLALTGTAVASDVINGKTFYNTNAKTPITGTLTDKSQYTPAVSVASGDQNLWIRIPQGAYRTNAPAGYPEITLSDSNFKASNIPANKNIFGLQGTKPYYAPTSRPQADGIWTGGGSDLYMHLPETGGCWDTDVYFHYNIPNLVPANIKSGVDIAGVVGNVPDGTGKKSFASGTATADSNGAFTVSGLAFRPYVVVIIQNSPQTYANKVNGQQNVRILTDFTFGAWYNGSVTCYGITTGYDQNYNVGAFYTSNKITANGFYSGKPDYPTGTLAPNASFTWYAYGAN